VSGRPNHNGMAGAPVGSMDQRIGRGQVGQRPRRSGRGQAKQEVGRGRSVVSVSMAPARAPAGAKLGGQARTGRMELGTPRRRNAPPILAWGVREGTRGDVG